MADFAAWRNKQGFRALDGDMEKMRYHRGMDRADNDRFPILVDFPPRQQGIAAALRYAFAATHAAPAECGFERLLAKIH